MKHLAWSLVWLVGCGRSTGTPTPSPVPVTTPAAASPAPTPPPAPAVRAGLAEATGDLDGRPGDERVVLGRDGTLVAGTASIAVPLVAVSEYFEKDYALRVIGLGQARRGVLLAAPTEGEEDPPTRYRVFVYRDGALKQVLDQIIGVYGVTDLENAPDGTLSYTESGWTACHRGKFKASMKLQRVTLALDPGGTKMAETRRVDTAEVQVCDELAACPFVYRLDGSPTPVRQGEILRNVRGAAAATEQSLAVGPTTTALVALQVTEEKREVTMLDHVYLQVGDTRVAPLACADAARAPAYCTADGIPHVLRLGDSLDLAFAAPPSATAALVARGYYIPTPTRPFRQAVLGASVPKTGALE